jgi:hypothetical protein
MHELLKVAGRMRVRVHVAYLDDPTVLGCYFPDQRAIYLSIDLTPVELRSVLAHELGHCFYGDACSTGATERRAERYAAALLITADDYAAAEAIDSSTWAIAEALRVTEDLVQAYQEQCLQKLGRRTYGRSRGVNLYGDRARQLSS